MSMPKTRPRVGQIQKEETMSIFDKIRKKISRQRKPPKKGVLVPDIDADFLLFIRLRQANGEQIIIPPLSSTFEPELFGMWQEENAKVLHKYYNLSVHEVLIATGIVIEETV